MLARWALGVFRKPALSVQNSPRLCSKAAAPEGAGLCAGKAERRHRMGPVGLPPCTSYHLRVLSLAGFHRLSLRAAHSVSQARAATLDAPSAANFEDFRLGEGLLAALTDQRLQQPTEIQAAAIPALFKGGDVILASHTGSGKTLAYLLPLVQKLKEQEAEDGISSRPRRPKALILGPTRELTDQILRVAKSISHHAKFRSTCVNGGLAPAVQREALAKPLDIVIGTPQKIAQHAEAGNLFYGDVQLVVLDEADTLLEKGFKGEVEAVLQPLRSKPKPAVCALVVATFTQELRKVLKAEFPGIRQVETRSLHKAVPQAHHAFQALQAGEDKLDRLLLEAQGSLRKGRRVMVFCNTLDSCRAVDFAFAEASVPRVAYHGDIPLDERKAALKQFNQPSTSGRPAQEAPRLMVCTDIAARGLDMTEPVDHIINFDFPRNPVDYLHRTGRTARAGASGRVTSLVTKFDHRLAQRIESALKAGQSLDQLSGEPEHIVRQRASRQADRDDPDRRSRGQPSFSKPPGTGGRYQSAGSSRGSSSPPSGSRRGSSSSSGRRSSSSPTGSSRGSGRGGFSSRGSSRGGFSSRGGSGGSGRGRGGGGRGQESSRGRSAGSGSSRGHGR